jgi:NitT/TauT family transport system substrate-binding protein
MVAGLAVTALPHLALARDKFTLAISIYAGWMPWYYAKDQGILKKWAERYKIAIDVVEMDYIPSIEAYVAGKVDAAVMTNMEALDMPARSGVDTLRSLWGTIPRQRRPARAWIADVKGLKGTEVSLVSSR